MVLLVAAENFVVLFIGFELLSIPLYVLCATHMRREHSLESGLKYLIIGSVGSATLLYGLALIYGATGSTDFSGVAAAVGEVRRRPAAARGRRARRRGARVQGLRGAVPPVDARRLRGRADADHGLHGRRHQGGRVRRPAAAVRRRADRGLGRLGPGAGGARGDHDRGRQRRRDRPVLAEAAARLLLGRPGGLHARRRGRLDPARDPGDDLLPRGLRADEHGRVRGDHRARARVGGRRRHLLAVRPRRRPARGWPGR